jgi:ABC-type glycerol-3-phosphate transport system substrate-binding protein
VRRARLLAAVAVMAVIVVACSSGGGSTTSSTPGSAAPVTLTIWHNYGQSNSNITVVNGLAAAFHALHPNITINVVDQSGANYFSQLQAAAISKTGPDLAVMWTGLFALKYKAFLANLQGKVPTADLAKVDPGALKWTADKFDPASGPFVMPFQDQFYIGFYNKALFTKAGITAVPSDWTELFAACQKLKAAGITPFVYGNGGQPISAEFYPWLDMSYMMIGALPVDQWLNLYSGATPWSDPAVTGQLANWAKLKSLGCTNQDVLTKTNNVGDFSKGKAAMTVDGTWDTKVYTDALGADVAAFIPPFSDSPIKGVVQFAGDGFGMMNYSTHQTEAAQFLDFMTTDQAVKIVNDGGLIPAIVGSTTSNPVNQQMLDFAGKQGMTAYPMLDNVIQGDVVDAGTKSLPSVLNGTISPTKAAADLMAAFQGLSADQKGTTYP